ncbi:uncharacterized protein [Manis javanica]|uniref:uncharacterized protein n=1 Tax=Manis javanica TaxID=9974 RepID=UPI003C6D0FB0
MTERTAPKGSKALDRRPHTDPRQDSTLPLPHPVTGRAARATRSPPLRAACREPEPLPVAPGHGTSTPIGPRENRSGVARPEAGKKGAENYRGSGKGGGEGSICAGRGVAGEAVGGAWVGWEDIGSYTRGGLSRRCRCRECGVETGAAAGATPGTLSLAPSPSASHFPGSAQPAPLRPVAPASISRPLFTTHAPPPPPPIMDPGSAGGGGGGGSSNDSAPDCWDQAGMEAPGPDPCSGAGGLQLVAQRQRQTLRAQRPRRRIRAVLPARPCPAVATPSRRWRQPPRSRQWRRRPFGVLKESQDALQSCDPAETVGHHFKRSFSPQHCWDFSP